MKSPAWTATNREKGEVFFFDRFLAPAAAYIGSCRSQSQSQEAEQEQERRRCKGAAHVGDLLVRST